MKFTKRSYVKVWQNCLEDQREDTTITLSLREKEMNYEAA